MIQIVGGGPPGGLTRQTSSCTVILYILIKEATTPTRITYTQAREKLAAHVTRSLRLGNRS